MSETGSEKTGAAARHSGIVALVRQRGFMAIEALANHFDVTVQTIRRDLNLLSEEGRVLRYHGGAGLPSSIENIDYTQRQVMNPAEKDRIARLVAAEVPDHASLFINIGTTTEAVARALAGKRDLQVITNNLNVASTLARSTDFKIVLTGGTVRNRDGGIVGAASCDMIAQFRVDFGIIGISGIDEQGTLLDFDYDEVRAARAIIRNSRATYLLADHTKFSRHPMVRMGSLSEVSALFTDVPPPPPLRERLIAGGVVVHVTEPIGP